MSPIIGLTEASKSLRLEITLSQGLRISSCILSTIRNVLCMCVFRKETSTGDEKGQMFVTIMVVGNYCDNTLGMTTVMIEGFD